MAQYIYAIPDSTTCGDNEELNLIETNNWFHSNGHSVIMQEIRCHFLYLLTSFNIAAYSYFALHIFFVHWYISSLCYFRLRQGISLTCKELTKFVNIIKFIQRSDGVPSVSIW